MKKTTIAGPMFSHLGSTASPTALTLGHTPKAMPGSAEYNNQKAARDQKISGVGTGRNGGGAGATYGK